MDRHRQGRGHPGAPRGPHRGRRGAGPPRQPPASAGPPLNRRTLLAGALAAAPGRAVAETRRLALPSGDGRLRPLGGLVLDDPALAFGGLSGLHLDPDLRITGVSDVGHWFTARLILDGGGPAGLSDLRTGRLRGPSGQPLAGLERDAESLAQLPDGTFLVGFERRHRIDAYRTIDGLPDPVPSPPGLHRAPRNGGLESLAVLADGRWLGIAESLAPEDTPGAALRQAWLGGPGRWTSVAYRPHEGYDPTDAVGLPGGGALVLERRFSRWGRFTGRIAHLPAAALEASVGTTLAGSELLDLRSPWPEENWEGMAITRHRGRTLVAVVSDDNQSAWQRQLLLLFALNDAE